MNSLSAFLESAHYRRVPLKPNGVGHFETDGTINGHPVHVLIDTGAARTFVDVTRAREFGLELQSLGVRSVGAGGAPLEIFEGVDVFNAQAAVIDYGSDSLFLRDPA